MASVKFMWLVPILIFALIIAALVFNYNTGSDFASALLTVNSANTQTLASVHSNVGSARGQKNKASKRKDTPPFSPLPLEVISSVKLFVLFVGYPRSGSSITGSILDAHPNVIMANEFNVLKWVQKNPNYSKDQLFNNLFENSHKNVLKHGIRRHNNKGYNLTVDNSWQGRYRETVNVIGDKQPPVLQQLLSEQPDLFQALYTKLQDVVSITDSLNSLCTKSIRYNVNIAALSAEI